MGDDKAAGMAWDLFVELRKEVVESQKIRAQIIGLKITFVSSAIGFVLVKRDSIPLALLVIPALSAIFFDLLIQSYSFSVKRIGNYCRKYLEPKFLGEPALFCPWEEFMRKSENRQMYSTIGNLGITILATVPAIVALTLPFRWLMSLVLLILLVGLLVADWKSFLRVGRYAKRSDS